MTPLDGYLFDNSALSPYYNPRQSKHSEVRRVIDSIPSAERYISLITLAEMEFGCRLAEAVQGRQIAEFEQELKMARALGTVLPFTHHTARTYAEIKAKVTSFYLKNPYRGGRPPFLEDWVDKYSGKTLGVDENDLWICAQAKERDLVLVAADKMNVITKADGNIRLLPV